jgi:hypothetical protein
MPARHHTDRRLAVGADRGADRDLLHRAVVPAHEDLLKGTVLAEAGQELPAAVGLVLDPLLDGSAAVVDVRPVLLGEGGTCRPPNDSDGNAQ